MNNRLQEILISDFKKDFREKIGRGLKILVCSKWESDSNFTTNANFWGIVQLIFDYTGWKWSDTYVATEYKDSQKRVKNSVKNEEKVFRRGIINYIAVANGVSFNFIAKETLKCNHTAIMYSVRGFEERLETDYATQKFFSEVLTYVRENYYLVKDKTTLKIGVTSDNI